MRATTELLRECQVALRQLVWTATGQLTAKQRKDYLELSDRIDLCVGLEERAEADDDLDVLFGIGFCMGDDNDQATD